MCMMTVYCGSRPMCVALLKTKFESALFWAVLLCILFFTYGLEMAFRVNYM